MKYLAILLACAALTGQTPPWLRLVGIQVPLGIAGID